MGTLLCKEHLLFTTYGIYDKIRHEVIVMPRAARKKSAESMYHIMSRSISEIDLFRDDEDKAKYLYLLKERKTAQHRYFVEQFDIITTNI